MENYRNHVESLSHLPEFQKDETEEKAGEQPAAEAEPESEKQTSEQETAEAAAPATEADQAEDPAENDKAEESSEDFWAKDETQLKLDPLPADAKPDELEDDAFQGVKFSE